MITMFEETQMRHLKLKNRLVRSATWEALAHPDGSASLEQQAIYQELAEGGVGLIFTGFTGVTAFDPQPAAMMRLCDDALIPSHRALVDEVHRHDCKIIPQIAMGGYYRKDAAGNLQNAEMDDLSELELQTVVNHFSDAAGRAQEAGYDGVQIHAAHHFFLSRCISPLYNHRTDQYGGSAEKRARILVKILRAIRQCTEDFHITIKLNFHDFVAGGLMPQDAFTACRVLEAEGIDSIEISANGTSRTGVKPGQGEAYFLDFALALKKQVDLPVILVGGHRSVEGMNQNLNDTPVEYLSLSRPLIREPDLPKRWQAGDTRPSTCISCNSCYSTAGKRCVFNQ